MKNETAPHPFDVLLEIDRRNRGRSEAALEAPQPATITGRLALIMGSWHLMFFMEDVSEIISVPHISRVPGVKPWLLGIANLRGTVISIIDLRQFLGGKPSSITGSSRIVVVNSGDWSYGMLIDEVIGMRHFSSENKLSKLDAIDSKLLPYVTEAFSSEGKLWLAFNVGQLLSEPRFLGAAN